MQSRLSTQCRFRIQPGLDRGSRTQADELPDGGHRHEEDAEGEEDLQQGEAVASAAAIEVVGSSRGAEEQRGTGEGLVIRP